MMENAAKAIPDRMFFRIRDVASLVGVKPYVLRYWETEFPLVSPQKSQTGQRVYRKSDVEYLMMIKHLLYQERYSIEGARKRIDELKKGGSLKSFKTSAVQEQIPIAVKEERTERKKRILTLAKELQALTKRPLREIFKA